MPNKTSEYAEEGTLAHKYASEWLEGTLPPENIDPEMFEAIKIYVEYCQMLIRNCEGVVNKMLIEHKFDLSKLYPGLFGTADCVIYDGGKKKLYVIDYKNGKGIPVSPYRNPQLMYYGLGALLSLNLACKEVELVIVQPRFDSLNAIKTWCLPALDLVDFSADLVNYAKATQQLDAPTNPGDHCHWCAAKSVCPALSKAANEVAKQQFQHEPMTGLSSLELSNALDKIPVVEAWIKGIREIAYERASQGKDVPKYKLVPKRGIRRWNDPHIAESFLKTKLSANIVRDLFTDPELKSPAQVEKIIGKANAFMLDDLVSKVSSGETLVREDDDRPAISKDAKSDFKNLA
jgi:hypothetical protein